MQAMRIPKILRQRRKSTPRTMRAALVLLSALVWNTCGGVGDALEGKELSFTTLARSSHSGVAASEGIVARTPGEFNAIWSRYSANQFPAPRPPVVDFKTTQVLGYFLGTRPSGCYSVAITRVSQTKDRLVVTYKETLPGPAEMCMQQLVNPAHLIAVPKSLLRVQFVAG